MKRFMISITEEMEKALEKERKKRMLGTILETAKLDVRKDEPVATPF